MTSNDLALDRQDAYFCERSNGLTASIKWAEFLDWLKTG